MICDRLQAVRQRIQKPVGDFHAAAALGDVHPDFIEVGSASEPERRMHQRGAFRSSANRARPRLLISSASALVSDMIRPLPSAIEASA